MATHYQTLGIGPNATPQDVRAAYRRLVKQHHPDIQTQAQMEADALRIREINAAYTVLKHAESRQRYDASLLPQSQRLPPNVPQTTVTDEAIARELWLQQVYNPLMQRIKRVLTSLKPQIHALSADPYDDELVTDFADYLDQLQDDYQQAQVTFRRCPNPSSLAGVASRLYYSLSHIGDALDELVYFPQNYDYRHIHTGQELFRLSREFYLEAAAVLSESQQR